MVVELNAIEEQTPRSKIGDSALKFRRHWCTVNPYSSHLHELPDLQRPAVGFALRIPAKPGRASYATLMVFYVLATPMCLPLAHETGARLSTARRSRRCASLPAHPTVGTSAARIVDRRRAFRRAMKSV